MAHQYDIWLDDLPLVLLCIKVGISMTSSELLYNEPIRLRRSCSKIFHNIRPTLISRPWYCEPSGFISQKLEQCKPVFVNKGPFPRALQCRYFGPYEILERSEKNLTLQIKDNTILCIQPLHPAPKTLTLAVKPLIPYYLHTMFFTGGARKPFSQI